jgi:hypothetical protein
LIADPDGTKKVHCCRCSCTQIEKVCSDQILTCRNILTFILSKLPLVYIVTMRVFYPFVIIRGLGNKPMQAAGTGRNGDKPAGTGMEWIDLAYSMAVN